MLTQNRYLTATSIMILTKNVPLSNMLIKNIEHKDNKTVPQTGDKILMHYHRSCKFTSKKPLASISTVLSVRLKGFEC